MVQNTLKKTQNGQDAVMVHPLVVGGTANWKAIRHQDPRSTRRKQQKTFDEVVSRSSLSRPARRVCGCLLQSRIVFDICARRSSLGLVVFWDKKSTERDEKHDKDVRGVATGMPMMDIPISHPTR